METKKVLLVKGLNIDSIFDRELSNKKKNDENDKNIIDAHYNKLLPYATQLTFAMVELHNKLVNNGYVGLFKEFENITIDDEQQFTNDYVNNTDKWKFDVRGNVFNCFISIWNSTHYKMHYTTNPIVQILYKTKGYFTLESALEEFIKDKLNN